MYVPATCKGELAHGLSGCSITHLFQLFFVACGEMYGAGCSHIAAGAVGAAAGGTTDRLDASGAPVARNTIPEAIGVLTQHAAARRAVSI